MMCIMGPLRYSKKRRLYQWHPLRQTQGASAGEGWRGERHGNQKTGYHCGVIPDGYSDHGLRWWSFAKQGNTIPDTHANANIYCDAITDTRARADRNPYPYPYPYGHANASSNSHIYTNCIAHSYQDTNAYIYANINPSADSDGHAYSGRASTL